MRRSGFTMIELIFVIVIIGILAAVAIPRLAGVQDDALVASEKNGIGSARSAVISIRGKALARGHNFNITVTKLDGSPKSIEVNATGTDQTPADDAILQLSNAKYPMELSLDDDDTNVQQKNTTNKGNAMAVLLERDGRDRYKTDALATNSKDSKIVGPATSSVAEDSGAELHVGQRWEYNSSTGTFALTGSGFND